MPDSHLTKMVPVLCYFKAWGYEDGKSRTWFDAIMVKVARSSEILEALNWEVSRRQKSHNFHAVFPPIASFRLLKYLPENGAKRFDQTLELFKREVRPCQRSSASSP